MVRETAVIVLIEFAVAPRFGKEGCHIYKAQTVYTNRDI